MWIIDNLRCLERFFTANWLFEERLKCFKHFGLGSLPHFGLDFLPHFGLDFLPVNIWCYAFRFGLSPGID
ncbi:unnamed protein product [Rhizophagus irregularis]|nr:unnamed protein product [Rhizophagus irregularis]CAB5215590.1 unnamed protein product [Rhizophagus irregularis]